MGTMASESKTEPLRPVKYMHRKTPADMTDSAKTIKSVKPQKAQDSGSSGSKGTTSSPSDEGVQSPEILHASASPERVSRTEALGP